eukprot:CAMPEP_0171132034 /NCGR_PEP_ID=MMETSP0766_2-20121228/123774_1 /TAXON_ID=439317 /ORGANISM="Gambierdiscus australes, Strain CAWD 149" /LENGTH=36 /DNA_ID= /DNA_START= /DNA_END= /DNA_ORIENTATION=
MAAEDRASSNVTSPNLHGANAHAVLVMSWQLNSSSQ